MKKNLCSLALSLISCGRLPTSASGADRYYDAIEPCYSTSDFIALLYDASLRWLKELNYVTRGVFAENLFASRPLHNIVSESDTIVRKL